MTTVQQLIDTLRRAQAFKGSNDLRVTSRAPQQSHQDFLRGDLV